MPEHRRQAMKEKKEKVKKEVIEVPTFTACSLEGESIEKDLTLIMKGDDGQKVSDIPFQVKLIPADQKEKIADAVQKIADVDAKIAELQAQADAKTTDTKKEDTKKTAKKKQEVSSLTGEAVTPLEQLYVDKQEAIDAYTETLSMVNAETYSDDDSDGMIYIESIDPGDYEACYIPTEGNDYSATNYAVDVNVKDKIEYVAVKNIAEKTVSASAAGDVQSNVKNVPVEATPTNTVEFVESRTEEIPAQYKQVATPVVQASAGAVATVSSTDGSASVGISQNATLYSGVNGANSVAISVQASGLTGEPQVTSSNGIVSLTGSGENYTITAGSTPEDATVNVTVSGALASDPSQTVSATCSVLVHGTNKALTASDGQTLYVDTNGTPATYGNYNPSGAYYVKEKDAETRYYGWQEIDGYRYYFDKNGNKVTGTQVINGATYNFGSDGVLLTSGFGIDKEEMDNTVYELMLGECSIRESMTQVENIEHLSLIPSNVNLAGAEIELLGINEKEYILKNAVDYIRDDYDFIIIDCPPSLNMLTVNAMTTADSILVPIQCEYYALEGISQLIHTIDLVQERLNPNLKIDGVVFTMYDARTNLSSDVVDTVKENLNATVYQTIIPRNVRLAEAPSHGLPINLYDAKSSGAESYRNLAKEIIERKDV